MSLNALSWLTYKLNNAKIINMEPTKCSLRRIKSLKQVSSMDVHLFYGTVKRVNIVAFTVGNQCKTYEMLVLQ